MTNVCMIVAATPDGIIGNNGALPWCVPEDLRHFKNVTLGYPIIMGRKTADGLGRPLPGRTNYVLSRQAADFPGFEVLNEPILPRTDKGKVFIIGGSEIYKAYEERIDTIYLSVIHTQVTGDAFLPFPIQSPVWKLTDTEYYRSGNGIVVCNQTWVRRQL